jgi:hypothetical protein
MANYTITFKSLSAGANDNPYVVNVGGSSGTAIALNGADQPFVTQEDDSEDMFTPIRTQSGYLRIVDNGKDANGTALSADWWKDIVPLTAFGRPITLTKGSTVVWQGYIQTQTFSGELYGGTQEREYPVICPLSVLEAAKPDTTERNTRSFAYLLWTILRAAQTTGIVEFNNIYFQGGADARTWLQTKIDWKNFHSTDNDGVVSAKYSMYQILEDVCTFWGWTCRTQGKDVYFTCADDSTEQNYLQVTLAQLQNLAGSTGTIISRSNIPTVVLEGDIFASTDNSDYVMNGPSRAVVTADVNKQKTVMQFAPKAYENQMDAGGYTWVQGEDDLTGFFTTQPIVPALPTSGLTTEELVARSSVTGSGFCRRQIFESTDSTDAEKVDAIVLALKCITDQQSQSGWSLDHQIEIDTVYPMDYTGGSFKFTGSLFVGCKRFTDGNELHMRFGIGSDRDHAKWWYMNPIPDGGDIVCGWNGTVHRFIARLEGGNIISTAAYHINAAGILTSVDFKSSTIPAPDSGGYGRLFIDIIGCGVQNFTIGDFAVEFSREVTEIPTNVHAVRPRVMKESRDTSHEYTAVNWNQSKDEWSADCIFASDNNLEYGYGLLLDASGGYVATVPYSGSPEHPEQHLANRVSNYWRNSKRKLMVDLRYNLIPSILPYNFVNIGGGPNFYPSSISHDWRNDKIQIGLMEISI